ncbi:sensor histidine kinase [Streptomyces sp. BE303]|uniref:sensor histidine kinase n=1 Tax=Streptomyces sp. BE303 TaxID=3002528 RepID=UPI002E78CDEF|nr:ATP-binding protein [Streptomyces sp. BE303]MED7952443.1 ATP-binding protein [Streptomyces sp. BE303]
MPGISAPRTGHRAGRSGSLRSSLLALALVPCLGLAAAWGYAAYLLRDSGDTTALYAGSAVFAAVLLWSLVRGIRVARSLPARLSGLREDTLAIAQHEIPQVVGRLQSGESVPSPPAWAPARRVGDEVQQTADGLAAVRQAAVAAIIHQAQGREGTKKVFLNIARRTQILIHRQISMLDALEREHEEPELLRELFAVDHLATRMRRNAENLVILGGALPARRWRNAVPMVNVLRSAVSETENYARVVVQGVPRSSLSGQAVADVIHLVAELIENGTTFSPPYTQVQVSAQEVPKGLAVEVEDRGLGMGEDEYERLNDYLANPPELDVSALGDDLRLGLFVVARLAARHAIQVTLRPSPYGGTRAVVLVPVVLLEQAEQAASVPGLPAGARVTRTPVPEPLPGPDADLGEIDEELSGALAGVLGGLLGTGPTPGSGGAPDSAPGAVVGRSADTTADTTAVTGDLGYVLPGHVLPGQAVPGQVAGGPEWHEAPLVDGTPANGVPVAGTTGGEGGLAISELLARYPMGGARGENDPAVNGGLQVGAQIPGLPGAVVVPRPVLPLPYEEQQAGDPAAGPSAGPAGPWENGSAETPGAGSDRGDGSGSHALPAAPRTPTHQRAEDEAAEHGPDGELRTPRVLPQRVRNASLAEQLREAHAPGAMLPPVAHPGAPATGPGAAAQGRDNPFGRTGLQGGADPYGRPGPAAPAADDLMPQRSRATMAAIQRGTRTARAAAPDSDAPATPSAPAAPSAAKEQQ